MVKRLVIITLVLLTGFCSVRASVYNSTNVDYATISAMTASYATAASMENMYAQDMEKISKSYTAVEAAMATIYLTKHMDRKALTNVDLWSDDENYYYRRIYSLVFNQILPKVIIVTGKCLKEPGSALYWGSYIMKVCSETKRLCQQFETVVTNGRLSFKDIPFLDFKEDFKKYADLTKLGHVDWKEQLKNFKQNWEGMFTEESLQSDYDMLYEMGIQLAEAGVVELTGKISPDLKKIVFGNRNDNFVGMFQQKVGILQDMVANRAFDLVDASMTGFLNDALGREVFERGDATALFTHGEYNIDGWISNYVNNSPNRYYTQKATITGEKKGSEEVVCDYTPDYTKLWFWNGNRTNPWAIEDWTVWESNFGRKGLGGFPDKFDDGRKLEDVARKASEDNSGWSQAKVTTFNNSQSEYKYKIVYSLLDYRYGPGSYDNLNPTLPNEHHGDYDRAVGYKIKVTRVLELNDVLYEELFDSYKMDWTMFENKLNTILEEYKRQAQQEGSPYYGMKFKLTYGPQLYYSRDDAERLKGAKSVEIIAECHDDIEVAKGDVQWKCDVCDGYGDHHMKECAMETSLTSQGYKDDISPYIDELEQQRSDLVARQNDIEKKRRETMLKLSSSSLTTTERQQLQAYYAELTQVSQNITADIDKIDKDISTLRKKKAEAEEDYMSDEDSYDRLPAIEKRLETIYGVRWKTAGSWKQDGQEFIYSRKGRPEGFDYDLTFEARVSIYDRAHYFLWFKIHRAKVRISWVLRGHGEDRTTIETMDLDPTASPESQAEKVNNRVDELKQDYPSCSIITEYTYEQQEVQDDTEDTMHLLWASERMEIARHIEARLTAIYADLCSLEKFLHYKHNIVDWLHDMVPYINNQFGRRHTIAEECRRRWMHSSGSKYFDDYVDERKDTTKAYNY